MRVNAACLPTVDPEYVLKCLKKVWRHLRGTFWLRLQYTGRCEKIITTASDASFAPQGSRSRTGITLFVGEDLIAWRSVRQGLVAWPTMESETDAAASGLQEAFRLQAQDHH